MRAEGAKAIRALAFVVAVVHAALLGACTPLETGAEAQTSERAAQVRTVRSPSPLGVPLHPSATSNEVSGRIPNGASVRVLGFTPNRRRLEVEGGGRRGFIVSRYVVREEVERAPITASPFDSREACASLARSAAADRPTPGALRIASWNVRWFPDGRADGPRAEGTDVEWLACAMASLRSDVIAVQEFVRHARGRAGLSALLDALGRSTGARWRAIFDDCPTDGRQHVGFLYREDRVRLDEVRNLAGINGGRRACDHRLRPGLYAHLSGPSGLEATLVNVHLDSGTVARDRANRAAATSAIVRLAADGAAQSSGRRLVVLGDFNTMGCEACVPRETGAEELDALVRALGAAGFVRAAPDAACTHVGGRRSASLDHVFVLGQAGAAPEARVLGPCAHGCTVRRAGARFFERLSDHCPVVVELAGAGAARP